MVVVVWVAVVVGVGVVVVVAVLVVARPWFLGWRIEVTAIRSIGISITDLFPLVTLCVIIRLNNDKMSATQKLRFQCGEDKLNSLPFSKAFAS